MKSFNLKKKVGLIENPKVQRKENTEEREKNGRKSEMERNPKQKRVKVKVKKNQEEGPE